MGMHWPAGDGMNGAAGALRHRARPRDAEVGDRSQEVTSSAAAGRHPGPGGRAGGRVMLAVLVLLTGISLVLGYANKARCGGPGFDGDGRTTPDYGLRLDRDVCYSDIQDLWLGRDIDQHVFPYVHGDITADGTLTGGAVEYPVLTGVLMWAGAVLARNDSQYLLFSAVLLAPFGLATGWMLGRLARWRGLLWALGPPLVLYAFHNWDLAAVACAVGAVFALHGWRTTLPLHRRAVIAAVLLGLGAAFKLYPGAFVAPLALYVLTASRPGRLHRTAALRVLAAAAGPVVLVNLPFALLGREGWLASFVFQLHRPVDVTTNSIWFWGLLPVLNPEAPAVQQLVGGLSPALVLASFAVALAVGWRRWQREGSYPWVAVSAAMLCGFLLFHKVHSPQYALWLLPFFVLLAVPSRWVAAYVVCDALVGIAWFRWQYTVETGGASDIYASVTGQALSVGVWGRATLLVVLFFVVLSLPDRLARARPNPSGSADQLGAQVRQDRSCGLVAGVGGEPGDRVRERSVDGGLLGGQIGERDAVAGGCDSEGRAARRVLADPDGRGVEKGAASPA